MSGAELSNPGGAGTAPSTSSTVTSAAGPERSPGVWRAGWQRLRGDRVGMAALAVVGLFLLLMLANLLGLVARQWQEEVAVAAAPPGFLAPAGAAAATAGATQAEGPASSPGAIGRPVDISDIDPLAPRYAEWAERTARERGVSIERARSLPLGADALGRDVLAKAVRGTTVSVSVGLLAAVLATALGTLLGALGGFLGGRVGDALEWLYNVFESVPGILLILAFAAVLGRGVGSIVLVLGFTGWTGMYRQVRAEFMRHAARDYVRAAEALGASAFARMFRHILPNVSHVVLVRMSLLVVGFIKAEVILSYLGLGVPSDDVSWGSMLAESQSELLLGHWWQLAVATAFMAAFVTAFSLLADAARDALDPRLRGLE
jgi:peptide/nickel transport system permease protein